MEHRTGTTTRDIDVSSISGGASARTVPAGTHVTVLRGELTDNSGSLYITGPAVGAQVYVEDSAVQLDSEYTTALDVSMSDELAAFAAKAIEDAAATTAAFIARLETDGAASTLRWKADDLLAAELAKETAQMINTGLARRDEGKTTGGEIWAHVEHMLQLEVKRGVTSQSSGLFTNEVAKARAVAAVNALEQGFGLSSRVFAARWKATRTVAEAEFKALGVANDELRKLKAAQERMRSPERKLAAQAGIDARAAAVQQLDDALQARLAAAGVPRDNDLY
jgi:hypothetical protein